MALGSSTESSPELQNEESPLIPDHGPANSGADATAAAEATEAENTTETPGTDAVGEIEPAEEIGTSLMEVVVAKVAEPNEVTPVPQVEEVDEIQAGPTNYGAIEGAGKNNESAKDGEQVKDDKEDDRKKKEKLKKSELKSVSDALKTDMASERTFFKWLWTGLHTGAIGSFIFIVFDVDKGDPMRLVVVGFSWIVALMLVLYGTFAYYRRRQALRIGDITVIPTFVREHSPVIVLGALALVLGFTMSYAIWVRSKAEPESVGAHAVFGTT